MPAQTDSPTLSTSADQVTARSNAAGAGVPNLVSCVYREGLSSVFHSQVLMPTAMHGDEVSIRLAVHVPLGHLVRPQWRRKLRNMQERASEMGVDVNWLPSPPARMRWLFSDVGRLSRWIKRHYGRQRVVLRCRNAMMTQIALRVRDRLPNQRILYDCRGAEVAELAQREQTQRGITRQQAEALPEVRRRAGIEADAVRNCDHILCVSQAMRADLIARHGVPDTKITVVPCCLDPEPFVDSRSGRDAVRRELHLEDKTVVTYCGSLAWYQLPQQSLRMVRLLQERRADVHFLAITTAPQQMQQEIEKAGLAKGRWSVISVPPSEVPRYLTAADMALLLRDDSIVNRVASPVKFAEYMAAGLPVVISPTIGDYSEAVARHGLGVNVRLDDDDDALAQGLEAFALSSEFCEHHVSERCVDFAAGHLSWATHLPRISSLYHRLGA